MRVRRRRVGEGWKRPRTWLVALTSIHWREAWKYGERAFRYCQHDLGHAIAAVRIAAGLCGWRARILPTGRIVTSPRSPGSIATRTSSRRNGKSPVLPARARGVQSRGPWLSGRTTRCRSRSPHRGRPRRPLVGPREPVERGSRRVDVHRRDRADDRRSGPLMAQSSKPIPQSSNPHHPITRSPNHQITSVGAPASQRGRLRRPFVNWSSTAFMAILAASMPSAASPWDAMWWDPRIHLALFVHRVDGLEPGLYLLVRNARALERAEGGDDARLRVGAR